MYILRSLTAIKIGVFNDLELCKEDTFYSQKRLNASQEASRDVTLNNVLLTDNRIPSSLNDDTFTMLYGAFNVRANTVR